MLLSRLHGVVELLACFVLLALHDCCHSMNKIDTFFHIIVLGGWPPQSPPAPAPAQQPAPVQSAIGRS